MRLLLRAAMWFVLCAAEGPYDNRPRIVEPQGDICKSTFVATVIHRTSTPPFCGVFSTWIVYDVNVAPRNEPRRLYWHHLFAPIPEIGGTYRFKCQTGTARGELGLDGYVVLGAAIIDVFSPVKRLKWSESHATVCGCAGRRKKGSL